MPLPKSKPAESTGAPALTDAEFALFRALMYNTAGISLSPAKRALVAGRLSKRLRELGHGSFRQYFDWINSSCVDSAAQAERQTAIDLLTTNETYFFREPGHFDFLRDTLLPTWGCRRVRLWSAACSSGEEAYTLGMIMTVHAGDGWEVQGTDINTQVIHRAQQGLYPIERSKNIPREYLRQCCLKGIGEQADTFRMDRPLRQRVHFSYANLMHEMPHLDQFDLVMLRNVMIYFDLHSKQKVVANVLRQLKPGGWLMVGHAESLNGVTDAVRLVRPSVYQKEAAA